MTPLDYATDGEFTELAQYLIQHGAKTGAEMGCYGEAADEHDIGCVKRALAHWEMEHFQEALNDFLEAVKLNPENKIALRGAGEMLDRLNRPSEALAYLNAAVKQDSEYGAAHRALKVAYYNTDEDESKRTDH